MSLSTLTTLPDEAVRPDVPSAVDAAPLDSPRRRRGGRPWWQQAGRPAWSVPARAVIALMTAVLYTWSLGSVGMGNTFYAAAVKSGTISWKAFFFGSIDPGNFITVDKPPASLWVMELSGRIFGFSSWSMLLPEALAGVATVMIVYRLVRRWAGEQAAVFAAVALGLTPIAVAMFRYNNPDALLTLLLVGAVWAVWSAIETGKTDRLVVAGGLVGLAFTTKSLEACIVLPPLALAYLWSGPPRLRRRLGQLAWAALAFVVSSSWWVAIVELWPASARPYLGGSTDNSELNLIFGYNGFSRLVGSGGSGGLGGGANFGGPTGVLRMFNDTAGGQISWLIPLALMGLVATWWLSRGRSRSDLLRAGTVLWGGLLLLFLVVFSDAKGVWHPYYTVVMAPAVAALAGAGVVSQWRLGRGSRRWCWMLPVSVVGTTLWAAILLERTSGYDTWLPPILIMVGALAATALLLVELAVVRDRLVVVMVSCLTAIVLLAGPTAYAVTTVNSPSSGGLVAAGPSASGALGLPGGARGAGGVGGAGGASSGTTTLDRYLESHRGSARYLVAVSGSQTAAPIIVATGQAVITMGGFTGSDPTPTLAQFEAMVSAGEVHYVLVGGNSGGGPGGSSSTTGAIDTWVESHGTVVPSSAIGGSAGGTLYFVASSAARS